MKTVQESGEDLPYKVATPTSPEVIYEMPEAPAADEEKVIEPNVAESATDEPAAEEKVNSMGVPPVSKETIIPFIYNGCRPSLSCDPGASGMGAASALKCADDCADEDADDPKEKSKSG